ncbi:glycosyltransferase [Sulfitobacter sp. KE29]|uniref:glycosyltransferase n=1 Tax=unclassified Sulfitobacter TaxID=196795 RepID=UPI0023E29618|nr:MULTISPECIES: glycosyltransferase [unclassified Sulfitobacter]MDF3419977.1 glycosyltransferase [Sulfitobacter sp. Ks38]MDF3427461.1 glycosyltransferase [Sulfitobacter sp. KE29]MDF3431041.1 glycosyltransferase [Sulfitobacter sp. S46]MDF3445813.1 glycosyltransferase [Sulfitobacter sp. KE31]MDF3549592.1 glycosyltransferase [Sulfitobacter sp. KE28]
MKVAIVHYWLVGMRGGEKVLEALLELYPQAVIVTHVYDAANVSDAVRRHEVRETFIGRLPGAKAHYQKYLPLMPLALELMDMQEFDLVISSESGPAKGIIVRPDATHISYCHSPMRYIWDHYHVYRARAGWLARMMMPLMAHRLRIWDVTTAARVDHFIANSSFIAQRIKTYYRREAEVVFPPVDTGEFEISEQVGDHYLLAGEMVAYKRADLAVEAFNASGRKLVVVGDGEMRSTLERKAGPNIKFLGRVPFDELKRQFATCRALVFPGEEDFGIVPVEVMACGRPVIAYGRGGALDTVVEGISGVLFYVQSVAALNSAIDRFEETPNLVADPDTIRSLAKDFDVEVFKDKFAALVARALTTPKAGLAATPPQE